MTRTKLALMLCCGLAISCGDDGGGVAADTLYQVACPLDPNESGCGIADDPVDFTGFDGATLDDGRTITARCEASDLGGSKNVTLSVGFGSNPLLTIRGLLISPDGGAVQGSSCSVEVRSGANTYGGTTYGSCGNVAPNDEQPCQITQDGTAPGVAYNPDGDSGPELLFNLECRNLRAPAAPADLVRDVTFPRMRNDPALIKVINCEGF